MIFVFFSLTFQSVRQFPDWPRLLQMALLCSFYGWVIFYCIYVPYPFIHSSTDGHLGCFQTLAVMNTAAMNTGEHLSFELWFSLDICPSAGLLSLMVALVFVFNGTSIVDASIYITTNSAGDAMFFSRKGVPLFLHILFSIYFLQIFKWWPLWPVWGDI